jgi:hypothetical protein
MKRVTSALMGLALMLTLAAGAYAADCCANGSACCKGQTCCKAHK